MWRRARRATRTGPRKPRPGWIRARWRSGSTSWRGAHPARVVDGEVGLCGGARGARPGPGRGSRGLGGSGRAGVLGRRAGAAHILQELLTAKSDDVAARAERDQDRAEEAAAWVDPGALAFWDDELARRTSCKSC